MPLTFRGHLRITFGVEATLEIKSYGERRIRMKMKQVSTRLLWKCLCQEGYYSSFVPTDSKLLLQAAKRVRCSEL